MAEVDLAKMLADLDTVVIFALFIIAMLRRWLILPRELDRAEKRIEELQREKDEYKSMAFRAVGLGERLADAAKDSKP
jgi:cell division protein FtsL